MSSSKNHAPSSNRRILFVQFTNPAGYPPLAHASSILLDRDWEIAFVSITTGASVELQFEPHPRVTIKAVPAAAPGWRQKLSYAAYCLRTLAFAAKWRPGWVYASDPLACIPALLLSLILRLRVLYHEHDSPPPGLTNAFWRLVMRARRALARRATVCVIPNEMRARKFEDETGVSAASVICVWNCPTRQESVDVDAAPEGGGFWLYYHGSINRERLPLQVVDCLALLPATVGLRVVGYETLGSIGYQEELVRHASAKGIAPARLDLRGPRPQRADILASARCSHLGLAFLPLHSNDPNMRHMTGASNKPFDYLACGIPILVSPLDEWEAMFVAPGYGRSCDPSSAQSIAAAVRWFLEHPAERLAMGSAGRERVRSEWNYESMFAPVLAVLEQDTRP